jgi:hypothetical protein
MVRLVFDLACTYEANSVDTDSCSANVTIAVCNARSHLRLSSSGYDIDPVIMFDEHTAMRRKLDQYGRV